MIYEVKKDEKIYEVDDLVFFDKQSKRFQKAFNELKQGDTSEFDNCTVLLLNTGRVIITEKEMEVNDEI